MKKLFYAILIIAVVAIIFGIVMSNKKDQDKITKSGVSNMKKRADEIKAKGNVSAGTKNIDVTGMTGAGY